MQLADRLTRHQVVGSALLSVQYPSKSWAFVFYNVTGLLKELLFRVQASMYSVYMLHNYSHRENPIQ